MLDRATDRTRLVYHGRNPYRSAGCRGPQPATILVACEETAVAEQETNNGSNAMRGLLGGDEADQRAEVNTVLRSLTEPELVIAETGFQGVAEAKAADVMMVLFHE